MTRDANTHTAAQNVKHILHTRHGFRRSDVAAATLSNGTARVVSSGLSAADDSIVTERCLIASGLLVERETPTSIIVHA